MKYRNKIVITAAVTLALLAAAGLSKPGSARLGRAISLVKSMAVSLTGNTASVAAPGLDSEERARTKHGWSSGVVNSVVRGTITRYKNDLVERQAQLTIYYKYPDRIRVEEESEGIIQAWGFGTDGEWRLRADSLTEEEKRDVRGWLRVWPLRLFAKRDGGGIYREVGPRIEGSRPAAPGRARSEVAESRLLDEAELEETIERPNGGGVPDQRAIRYLIDRESSIIKSALWIEPDNPAESVDDPNTRTKEVRIDFSGWRRFEGVLLPTQVTRWVAGKADFTIDISEILVNQGLPNTVFQNPAR